MNAVFYYCLHTNKQFVNLQSKIAKVHDGPVSGGLGHALLNLVDLFMNYRFIHATRVLNIVQLYYTAVLNLVL